MVVRILSPMSGPDRAFLFPLRAFRRQLSQLGVIVHIHRIETERLLDCDVLGIVDFYWRRGGHQRFTGRRLGRLEFVQRYQSRGARIIYFDFRDSTGQTCFEILPWVNVYAKRQLLADLSSYCSPSYATAPEKGAGFASYYHQHLGVRPDPSLRAITPASADLLRKLELSWNCGMFYWLLSYGSRLGRAFHALWPPREWHVAATRPSADRPIDASFRGTLRRGDRVALAFQRGETVRQLAKLGEFGYSVAVGGRLRPHEYLKELTRSKVVPSPFGVGEVCFRDFECYVAGAGLLKPDMTHLVTWPPYYESGITYMPHRWDFADFEERFVSLVENRSRREEIARNGQERYLDSLSEEGGLRFAHHFKKLVEKAATEG